MTELLQANAFKIPLKDKSCNMCMTSPPYYSLRKYAGEQEFVFGGDKDCAHEWYGAEIKDENYTSSKRWQHGHTRKSNPDGWETTAELHGGSCTKCNAWRGAYGLEPTLQMYIDHTVEWCREVWRVLRGDGTFWLNLGDSYAGSGKGPSKSINKDNPHSEGINSLNVPDGLKPKDLMGVPWRVALALQADGWYLRSDIIWHKPNPMPESVTDRPTKSHEYLFLLTKSKKYYYDADAIREANTWEHVGEKRYPDGSSKNGGTIENPVQGKGNTTGSFRAFNPSGRNKRSVWKIATAPYSGAHFATYPPALVEPCIKAGTSEHGVCPECGNPWERVVEKNLVPTKKAAKTFVYDERDIDGHSTNDQGSNRARDGHKSGYITAIETLGWQATCDHDLEPIPATVLDPYSGSGTTLLVARKLGRKGVGLDISADYLDLAKERLSIKALHEWEHGVPGETNYEGLPMFEATG